jgi:hypothetical protein
MQKLWVKQRLLISILTCVSLLLVIGFAGMASACMGTSTSDYSSDSYMSNWNSFSDPDLNAQISQENVLLEKLKQDKALFEKTLQDKTIENQIVLEQILIENLKQDKVALESALQDKTLEAGAVEDKASQLTTVQDKITAETAKLNTLLADKTVNTQILQDKTSQLAPVQDKITMETVRLNTLQQAKSVQNSMYQVSVPASGGGISGLKVKFPKSLKTPPGADYLSYMVSPYNAVNFDQQKVAVARAFNAVQIQTTQKTLLQSCNEHLGAYTCAKGTKVAF